MFSINKQSFSKGNITIVNRRVSVNGTEIDLDKCLTLHIEGEVGEIRADYVKSIDVKGNVTSLSTMSGDVSCGDVAGSVSTMSGDVECKNVGGSVSTMSGDVRRDTRG